VMVVAIVVVVALVMVAVMIVAVVQISRAILAMMRLPLCLHCRKAMPRGTRRGCCSCAVQTYMLFQVTQIKVNSSDQRACPFSSVIVVGFWVRECCWALEPLGWEL
jgi:hypothetical protein